MTAPLLELCERVCQQIGAHGEAEAAAFGQVLLEHRPEAFGGLPGGASGDAARSAV